MSSAAVSTRARLLIASGEMSLAQVAHFIALPTRVILPDGSRLCRMHAWRICQVATKQYSFASTGIPPPGESTGRRRPSASSPAWRLGGSQFSYEYEQEYSISRAALSIKRDVRQYGSGGNEDLLIKKGGHGDRRPCDRFPSHGQLRRISYVRSKSCRMLLSARLQPRLPRCPLPL